ncbi:MAG TPA: hypothetical protein VIR27_21135 [Mycobacteriales bacterium]
MSQETAEVDQHTVDSLIDELEVQLTSQVVPPDCARDTTSCPVSVSCA